MRRRRLLGLAVFALAGCLERDEPTGPPGEDDPELVEIVEDRLEREDEGTDEERVWVEGVAENVSDQELTLVEIAAVFFDADGQQLDRTVEHIDDVTSGQRWEFEIQYPQLGEAAAAVVDYDLEVVTNL